MIRPPRPRKGPFVFFFDAGSMVNYANTPTRHWTIKEKGKPNETIQSACVRHLFFWWMSCERSCGHPSRMPLPCLCVRKPQRKRQRTKKRGRPFCICGPPQTQQRQEKVTTQGRPGAGAWRLLFFLSFCLVRKKRCLFFLLSPIAVFFLLFFPLLVGVTSVSEKGGAYIMALLACARVQIAPKRRALLASLSLGSMVAVVIVIVVVLVTRRRRFGAKETAAIVVVGRLGKGERARIGQKARKARGQAVADRLDAGLGLALANTCATLGLVVARHAVPRERASGQLHQCVGQGFEIVAPALHCKKTTTPHCRRAIVTHKQAKKRDASRETDKKW